MYADRLTFVTSNKHKAEEVAELFRMHGVALNLHFSKTIEIQSENLAEVALFSAIQAFNQLGGPVFVEDSGLFVEELNGFPGPYSSYVYKTLGLEKFLKLIGEDRRAVFRSVICVYGFEDGPRFFVGSVKGTIASEPKGRHGFGFDPVFIPDGSTKTLAEMSVEEKNKFSHRGDSVGKLLRWLYKDRQGLEER